MAVAVEDLGPSPEETEYKVEGEGGTVVMDSASNNSGGLYIPEFLGEAPDGNWGLNVRMAQAIKDDEAKRKKCFVCQSPDHFIRDCPVAKNGRGPLQPRGPPKNKLAPVGLKGKASPSLPTPQAAQPLTPQPNAPTN